ncbi:hypothetical protein OROGR_031912 [Orobanche gracilis]
MEEKWIFSRFYDFYLIIFLIFLVSVYVCDSQEEASNTYIISSFSYAKTQLKPYEWRYIRVELPPWFSSMNLALESDGDLDLNNSNMVDQISIDSFVGIQSLQNMEKCYPMLKNISLRVTSEQISPGVWYFGLFNGIGPTRTQSKMINRGNSYSFSGNVSVEGCTTSMMLGRFCNQTINMLSCNDSYNLSEIGLGRELYKRMGKNIIACTNANGIVCHQDDRPKIYLLDVLGTSEKLIFAVANLTFDEIQTSNVTNSRALLCYARHGAMPFLTVYDFSGDISKTPLVIDFPKAGRWYITVQPIDISNKSEAVQNKSSRSCYLLDWQVVWCPVGKAGLNCTFERYMLQPYDHSMFRKLRGEVVKYLTTPANSIMSINGWGTMKMEPNLNVLRKNPSFPFESSYIPITGKVSSASTKFPLEPLLSNISAGENTNNDAWTFFLLDVPYSATGTNIHVLLTSETKISYELFARYGGLPSLTRWDYFYANSTSSSNGSVFFRLYDSSEEKISFYILYVRGGTWSFGLRQPNHSASPSQTMISLTLERCPNKCSSHGSCQSVLDTSGLTLYRVTALVIGTMEVSTVVLNLCPVEAFAEWILFTSSGVSSALYHACDVGTWCALSFHVLQFLDFWLSFMAVVTTFVYLSTISDVSKRTIHTVLSIITALLAETGPTRSKNIGYVLGLGAAGLLLGWLFEFGARNYSFSCSGELHLNIYHRWEITKGWIRSIIKTIILRFKWGFILAGCLALAVAAVSWKMESTESYWIWHRSLWHIFIYTSSFLFLCSKAKVETCENERSSDGSYALPRQNSFIGGEQRQGR